MVAETRKTNNRDLSPSKLMIPPPPPDRHLLYNRGVCRVDDFRIFAIFTIKKLYSTVVPTKVLLGLLLLACDDDYNILWCCYSLPPAQVTADPIFGSASSSSSPSFGSSTNEFTSLISISRTCATKIIVVQYDYNHTVSTVQ